MKFLLQNSVIDGKKPVFTMREPFSCIAKASNHPTLLAAWEDIRTFYTKENTPPPLLKAGCFLGVGRESVLENVQLAVDDFGDEADFDGFFS